MARQDEVKARVAKLIAGFEEYVQAYDDNPPFSAEQLRVHRKTVALRQQAGSVRAAVESSVFIESLYLTLRKWRIGQRQSKLVPLDDFKAALRAVLPTMEQLESVAINGTGLPAGLTEGVVLFLVDHPLISAKLVDTLIERFISSGKAIVLPTFDGRRGHPAIFRSSLYGELLAAPIEVGARSVVWAHASDVLEVPTDEEGVVLNLNDPDTMKRALGSDS